MIFDKKFDIESNLKKKNFDEESSLKKEAIKKRI